MTLNTLTNTGAVAAVASPWWLPVLHSTSEYAALTLPILGVVWLSVQIGVKMYSVFKHGPK